MGNGKERPWHLLFVLLIAFVPATANLFLFSFAMLSTAEEWGITPFGAAVTGFLPMAASPLGGILFGSLSDHYGRRKALLLSILVSSISSVLSGLSFGPLDFAAYRLLLGMGSRGQWTISMTLVGETWQPEERGKAVGIVQSSFPVGYLYASIVALAVTERFGWRALFMLGALPAIFAAPLAYLAVKESHLWAQKSSGQKAEIPSYGEVFGRDLLRYTVLGTLVMFIGAFGAWAINPWIPTYLAVLGVPAERIAMLTLVIMLGALIGYAVYGFISDRLGRKLTFQIFFIGMAAALASFGFFPSQTWFIGEDGCSMISIVLMGGSVAFFLGYYSGYGTLFAELFPTAVRSRGMGFCYSVGGIGSAIGPASTGYLSSLWGIGSAFVITSCAFLIGSMLIQLFPETRGKIL